MAKYRFRKMYFICENKKVINSNVQQTNAYQFKAYADGVFDQKDKEVKMWHVHKPPIHHSLEAFYLVPEQLFDEILKKYTDEG
jgi:hypothetical protein